MAKVIAKNQDECIGCGLCVELCPDIFGQGEDKPVIVQPRVEPAQEECVQNAVDSCPVSCIYWA